MIDLNRMSRIALKAAKKRETKGQLKSDTFSILKHCAGEVCEATQAYCWVCTSRLISKKEVMEDKKHYADELADVITCALIAAAQEGVDIESALRRVQEKNRRRLE